MLPAMLAPVEKRALDLLADWPWLTPAHLGAIMVLRRSRLAEIVGRLTALDLALDAVVGETPPPRRQRPGAGDAGPQGPRLGGGPPGGVGAPLQRRTAPLSAGATSPAGGQDSFSGTSSTPPPSTHSSRPWRGRPDPAPGRSSNSTRLEGPPATSGTPTASAPSTPTPSASCAGAMRPGPSSWSGSAGPCVPSPWRPASPPTCATTPPSAPPTTTGRGPTCWSSSTTTSPRPTSCASPGRRMARAGVDLPLLVSHRELVEREGPLGRAWRRPGVPRTNARLHGPLTPEHDGGERPP